MQLDAFSSYAEQAVPKRPANRREVMKAERGPSALDKKMEEKQRLSKAARILQRERYQATLAAEPRLTAFIKFLRSIKAGDGAELVEAIADSWLPASPQPVRMFALRMVDERCNRINRQLGYQVLDDPLPPETCTYFEVRALLRGRV